MPKTAMAWNLFYSNKKMPMKFSKKNKQDLIDFCRNNSICVYSNALWVKFGSWWIELYPFRGFSDSRGASETLGAPRLSARSRSDGPLV